MNTIDCSAVVDDGSPGRPDLDGSMKSRFRLQPARQNISALPSALCPLTQRTEKVR